MAYEKSKEKENSLKNGSNGNIRYVKNVSLQLHALNIFFILRWFCLNFPRFYLDYNPSNKEPRIDYKWPQFKFSNVCKEFCMLIY